MKKPNQAYPAATIIRWLWNSSSDNRLQAILNTVIGLLQVVVSLSSVWAVQHAIDVASHHAEGNVIESVVVIGGLIMGGFVLSISTVWVKNILGIKAQNRMQHRMLGRILHSEWRGRDSMHSGDVLNRLESDVNTVVSFVAETLPSAVSTFTLFVGAFVYLFLMDHKLAIIIAVMFPIFLVASKIYMKKMRQLSRDVRDSDSVVQSVLQESVQNRVLVKTLESEDEMVERLSNEHTTLRKKVARRTKFSVFSNFVVNIGFSTGYLLAFGWSALRMSDGSLTFGGMTAFLQLVNKIQDPVRSLSQLVPKFVNVFIAAERLMIFEDIPLEEHGASVPLEAPCGISFNDVSYAYTDNPDSPIIRNLSFDFKPGTCTAIIGETGAGKTTLLRLILSLVHPVAGTVYLYNKVAKVLASPLTRCNITYVPQGNTLLSGSIRDNLLLGNVDATDKEMFEALDTACAGFVRDFPEGLDTVMSEQGGGLSEGQAQRICIARALLRNSPLMILDEATSALDPETENRLLQNILKKEKGDVVRPTVLFITHRPAVIQYCDASLHVNRIRD